METPNKHLWRWSRDARRGKDGKPVVAHITPHDLEIFSLLARHGFLTLPRLHHHLGGNIAALRSRMDLLFREPNYFVERPERHDPDRQSNTRYITYELDQRGIKALQEANLPSQASLAQLRRGRHAHIQFPHQVMISNIMESIELGCKEAGLTFFSLSDILNSPQTPAKLKEAPDVAGRIPIQLPRDFFKNGEEADADRNKYLWPDAIFGIGYPGDEYWFYALEADRNNEPVRTSTFKRTSILKKLLGYRDINHRKTMQRHLGIPNLRVLFVTTNEANMENMMTLTKELSEGGKSRLFLFKAIESLRGFDTSSKPTPHVLSQPWKRVGYPNIYINTKER